jgi:hypothetical protein
MKTILQGTVILVVIAVCTTLPASVDEKIQRQRRGKFRLKLHAFGIIVYLMNSCT